MLDRLTRRGRLVLVLGVGGIVVSLVLGQRACDVVPSADGAVLITEDGRRHPADVCVVADDFAAMGLTSVLLADDPAAATPLTLARAP